MASNISRRLERGLDSFNDWFDRHFVAVMLCVAAFVAGGVVTGGIPLP